MGIDILELSHGTGCVLECSTTGNVFGFRFGADVEAVKQFLQWLDEDARYYTYSLRLQWTEFRNAYKCAGCAEGPLEDARPIFGELEHMTADLEFCQGCRKFFCMRHAGEEWSDGDYGHKC
ncbi:hypothetical protein LCGC14_1027350 [marine sediment metagenome]|uniref:Uncharacterized protein n=1 Tax=marine sediment metagenome TaxID=412755 RepID=A0A0F9R1L3_9ZZZZ